MSKNDYEKLGLQSEKLGLLKAIRQIELLIDSIDRRLDQIDGEL
jgi:hypothetical protein